MAKRNWPGGPSKWQDPEGQRIGERRLMRGERATSTEFNETADDAYQMGYERALFDAATRPRKRAPSLLDRLRALFTSA